MNERDIPKKVIREELGGDYYYRCPWIVCNEIVKSGQNYCSNCGQRLKFDDYEDYDYGKIWSQLYP